MEIDKIKELKQKLDLDLNRLIKEFQDNTGLRVSYIDSVDCSNKCDMYRPNIIVKSVVKLEL